MEKETQDAESIMPLAQSLDGADEQISVPLAEGSGAEAPSDALALPREKKRFTILGVEFVYLYLFGIGIAHLGWLIENIVKLINHGYIDDKFHMLPFISPYALIAFAYHIALGDPDDLVLFGKRIFKVQTAKTKVWSNIISFLLICLFVFLGELAVGNLWEIFFGVRLWDYHSWPLNVTRYTSVVSTVGFGAGAYLIFRFVYKPVLKLIREKVSFRVAKIITLTLGVAIVVDTSILMFTLAICGDVPHYWHVQVFVP